MSLGLVYSLLYAYLDSYLAIFLIMIFSLFYFFFFLMLNETMHGSVFFNKRMIRLSSYKSQYELGAIFSKLSLGVFYVLY